MCVGSTGSPSAAFLFGMHRFPLLQAPFFELLVARSRLYLFFL